MPSLPLTERNTSNPRQRAIAAVNGKRDRRRDEDEDEGEGEGETKNGRVERNRGSNNVSARRRAHEGDRDDDDESMHDLEAEDDFAEYDDLTAEPQTAEQRRAKERQLRAHYRNLGQSVQESRDNINDTTVDLLGKQVLRANKLFRNVTGPSEAVLDSRVLMAASDAGALKARQLKLDADAFDTDQFLAKLAQFMGGALDVQGKNKGKGRSHARGSEVDQLEERPDEHGRALRWGRAGRVLAGESRRVVSTDFMLGPLALELKEKRVRTQRARQRIDESQRVRPEELRAEDVEKDKQATDRMIKEISQILEDYGAAGVPYLELVVNPESFAQTVENIFYFSFLVRDGRVCVEEEIDESAQHYGEVICYSCEPPDGSHDMDTGKSQFVFELTQEVWRDAIEAFDIRSSAIPHRERWQEQTNAKWR